MSWEQWNAGGGGTTELEVPTKKEEGGKARSLGIFATSLMEGWRNEQRRMMSDRSQ
jgi:hypothetical protein